MSKLTDKTTVYIDPLIKKSVRYYALRDDKSLSQIINDQLFEYLEHQEDLRSMEEAKKDSDVPIPLEDALKEMGISIDELRRRNKAKSA